MEWILKEAIEIELQTINMNTEDGFFLSGEWKPIICNMKEWRQSHAKVLITTSGP
jgi:hypothetical protein